MFQTKHFPGFCTALTVPENRRNAPSVLSRSHVAATGRCARNAGNMGFSAGKIGDPGRIRTCDLQLRRLLLYPLSYGAPLAGEFTPASLYRILH
jgi:hypothetical protein